MLGKKTLANVGEKNLSKCWGKKPWKGLLHFFYAYTLTDCLCSFGLHFQEAMEGLKACQRSLSEQPTDPEEIKRRAQADPEIQVLSLK